MRRRNHQGKQQQMSSSGPLLTNHLRDLDIELELLKRKREIIEQKQDILNRERYSTKRQYDYNPTNPYNYQESCVFSQQYDGSGNSGNYRPQGNKRPAESQNYSWNTKRTNSAQINPWQAGPSKDFSQERHFQPFQPQSDQFSAPAPLMSLKPHGAPLRPQKKFQLPPVRKNFNPTKITKPKPQSTQAPNKLASYPTEQTKQLVNNAMKAIDKKPTPNEILRADRPPSGKMKGRLELALGIILKKMKTLKPELAELEVFLQRLLKHTIRARIRALMLNKYVGAADDIVKAYRRVYPDDTDGELLSLAKNAHTLQLVDADDPEEFFKQNMTNILNNKLEDMFVKLEKLCRKEATNLDEYIDKLPQPNENKEKKTERSEPPKPLTMEEICGEDLSFSIIKEKMDKTKHYTKIMETFLEDQLPKVLPKYKNLLLSIVFCDKEFIGTKAMITAQLKKKIMKTIEKDDSYLFRRKKVKCSESETTKSTIEHNDTNDESIISNTEDESKTSEINVSNETIVLNEVITNKVEEIDSKVENEKPVQSVKVEEPEKEPVSDVISTSIESQAQIPQTPKMPLSKDIHYVKLIGRPTLPARAVIYNFLNKFNPQSIKKHKSISNLLVIGFNDKENFNKILEANESIVGESTIIIKVSEQVNAVKSTPNQNKAAAFTNISKSLNMSLEDSSILCHDLGSQITDLLTSIRKCEESVQESDKTNNDNEKETTTEDTVEIIDDDDEKKADNNDHSNTDNDEIKNTDDKNNEIEETCTNEKNDNELKVSTNGNEETKSGENNDTCNVIIETNSQNIPTETKESVEPMETDKELEAINENSENQGNSKKGEDKANADVRETGCTATPTRTSSRLAHSTPSTIRTRRTSRLQ